MKELQERTLLLIKPDGTGRGLIGECIRRFEDRGFQLLGLKLVRPTVEHMRSHYSGGDEWVRQLGKRTIDDCAQYGRDPKKELGSEDTLVVGNIVLDWLIEFTTSGPIVAMVMNGPNAVEMCRKIVGHTVPQKADIGSIRGDFSIDSPMLATLEKRAITNLMHASGNVEEAEKEIAHWFLPSELIAE